MSFSDYESEEDERDYNRWLTEFSKMLLFIAKSKTDVNDFDYDGIDPIFNLGTR